MADSLVDTAVIIDLLRGYPPAITWKNGQGSAILGITPFVWMEIVDGASNKRALEHARRMLSQFELVMATDVDIAWSMRQHVIHRLKSGVGMIDCLIAAPAYRLQLPLFTRNLKHFTPLLGPLAQLPY